MKPLPTLEELEAIAYRIKSNMDDGDAQIDLMTLFGHCLRCLTYAKEYERLMADATKRAERCS